MNNNILPSAVFEPHVQKKKELPFIYHLDTLTKVGVFNIHENPEILYITDGGGWVDCGGERYPVHKGDTVIIDSYTAHRVVPDGLVRHFCLIIDRSFCKYHSIDPRILHFTPLIRNAELSGRLERVMEECATEDPFQYAAIKSAVLELLVFLCRNYSTPKPESDLAEDAAVGHVRCAIEYIKKNLGKKLTADEVAAQAGLSKYYFLRVFKRVTGYTMTRYINLIRCEYAKELLHSGEYSVKEVALLCGFDNFSYFSNVFKTHTGSLPSELLEQ